MSSRDDDDLDHILGGPMSNGLVIMTESSLQQPNCSQNLLAVTPAPTNDAGSTAELPSNAKAGQRNYGEEALQACQRPGVAKALPLAMLCQ